MPVARYVDPAANPDIGKIQNVVQKSLESSSTTPSNCARLPDEDADF